MNYKMRKSRRCLMIPILIMILLLSPGCSSGTASQGVTGSGGDESAPAADAQKDQSASEAQGVSKDQSASEGQGIAKDQSASEDQGVSKDQSASEDQSASDARSGEESGEAEFEPFIRMDRDDPNAWKEDLDNVRFEKKGLYEFGETNEKYGINDIVPSEEGMDDLCISGSAQFSLPQFVKFSEELRNVADGKEIYIIDLRRESHVFLGPIPVSWYESHDWGNVGLTLEEIEEDEIDRFAPLVGQTIKAYGREDDDKINETEIDVKGFLREKELVESFGFHYYRLPIQDHTWPKPEQIDEFINFVKGIDMDNTWLHFHCQAGKGRTGIFMTLYDKMKNPQVPLLDVAVRQTKLGGSYPLYTEEDTDNYKIPFYAEKARMLPLFDRYVEENCASGYEVSWSEWLEENDESGTESEAEAEIESVTEELQPAA